MKKHRCYPPRRLEHLTVNQGGVGSSPTVGAMKKVSFVYQKALFSMISVPIGTGDICSAYDIR